MPLGIPAFHQAIYRDLESSLTRLNIIAPTGFGKSTVVGFAFPLWLACFEYFKEILYVGATAEFAEYKLSLIANEIESNNDLRNDFDLRQGKIWKVNEIELSNGVRILARGKGSQITGMRPECIILDDIETEKEARSETERAALREWFYLTLLNRPLPAGKIIQIGSLSSKLSWGCNFLTDESRKEGWTSRVFALPEDDSSIWPEMWSNEDIQKKKRELTPLPGAFEALFKADPGQFAKYAFKKEWIRYYDKVPQGLRVFTAVDLGAGEEEGNSYTAIVTIGIDQNSGAIYVLDFIKRRYNVETLEMFGAMFMVYEVYKPIRFGIESVAFQKYIKQFFEKECRERGKTPNVIELKRDNQVSKDYRIRSLSHWFEEGKIFIRPDQFALIAEYEAYPEVSSCDGLDALSMAVNDMAGPGKLSSNVGKAPRPEMGIGNIAGGFGG